ncbi:DnaB-like helicase C-terminal domain-containing protein, partial [Escherichia coli]
CAKRIDANLLDVSLDDIDDGHISYAEYKGKMEKWRSKNTLGRLIIKQYPTGGAHANTFRALLNELKLKKNFVPDVIIIDYLGICASC